MLEVKVLGPLLLAGDAGAAHLSAASGLVRIGRTLYVVADDEHELGRFDLSSGEPGQRIALFDGELPLAHGLRKARKPDCEALVRLPAFGDCPHGALMALGSGSRATRLRASLLPLDPAGGIAGPARCIDATAWLSPLRERIGEVNVEGAFVQGELLCLLQRGNSRSMLDARIDFAWRDVQRWIVAGEPAPRAVSQRRLELGTIDGVPLTFTDGAALAAGEWLFSAAAEDTADTYADGRCAGSAVGIVNAGGSIRLLEHLSLRCKVEGIAVAAVGSALELLLVTDADDRSQPALLLGATLPLPRGR